MSYFLYNLLLFIVNYFLYNLLLFIGSNNSVYNNCIDSPQLVFINFFLSNSNFQNILASCRSKFLIHLSFSNNTLQFALLFMNSFQWFFFPNKYCIHINFFRIKILLFFFGVFYSRRKKTWKFLRSSVVCQPRVEGGGGDGVSNSSVKYGNKISVFVFVGRRERHQYSIIFFRTDTTDRREIILH